MSSCVSLNTSDIYENAVHYGGDGTKWLFAGVFVMPFLMWLIFWILIIVCIYYTYRHFYPAKEDSPVISN